MEEWRTIWDDIKSDDPFEKALELLRQYSGYIQFLKITGSLARIITGRWRTNHGDAILAAIKPFQHLPNFADIMQGAPNYAMNTRTIEQLFTNIRVHLNKTKMKPDGDLYKIIQVIEEKTGKVFERKQNYTKTDKEEESLEESSSGLIV